MSQNSGRDGSTSHAPYVSPTTSSNTSLRNNAPAGSLAVLGSTLIPRDYLSSSSKSRLNATDSVPHPASPLSTTSSSGVSSQATARALAHEQSSDDEDYEDETVNEEPDETPLQENLNIAKTRPNAPAATQKQPLQKSSSSTGSARAIPSPTNAPVRLGAMPRTSSIDSAISTISNSSHPSKSSSEGREPSATDIRNLIATAGSAENLVSHLLRDKAHAASQNAQLWKLVDKQRALLLGLNKDLERVTKERDRYRKKSKELQALGLSESAGSHAAHSQTPPTSAGDEPRSQLPLGPAAVSQANGEWTGRPPEPRAVKTVRSPVDAGMMPHPLHLQQHLSRDPPNHNDRSFDPEPASPTLGMDLPIQRMEDDAVKPPGPKLSALTTQLAPPAFSVTEATPLVESPARGSLTQRRAPPKPLNLTQTREEQTQSGSEDPRTSVQESEAEAFERGRRKTREDDDRDREIAVLQEHEARSRSKKEKRSKVDQLRGEELPVSPNESTQHPQTNRPHQISGSPHLIASPPIAGLLHHTPSGTEQRLLSPPLRSPGLPASPRPSDRPLASPLPTFMAQAQATVPSLPMSPRDGGFALSPRAPKQPLPPPTNLHGTDDAQSHNQPESHNFPHCDSTIDSGRPRVHEHTMSSSEIPTVYRGLVSPTWPDLLLPPNALPSIQVKVASSRLRPSRFSVLGFRPQEDTAVFSLSVFSRSNAGELWRVEKVPAALPHLDQQLRPRCPEVPRLPDRKLFTGHAPAIIDARRSAVDAYFEDLLDTHIDEQSALIICKFLSTDVLEPQAESKPRANQMSQAQDQADVSGKSKKTGYLTKKGKNFGGWKSRYFVLESSKLRYFEGPGGAHLGTIRLYNAKIGRQTAEDGSHDDGDTDSQFRHAFLILEPKRRNENRYVRHVLCAENDTERDDWVRALLHHVEESTAQDARPATAGGLSSESASVTSNPRTLLRGTDFADGLVDSTAKSSSPTIGPHNSGNESPTSPSPATPDASNHDGYWSRSANAPSTGQSSTTQRFQQRQPQPIPQPNREQKIRNLFQFRKSSHEQLSTSQSSDDRTRQEHSSQRTRGYVRPVFGLSLAEAVEVCPPQDVDVLLPAVVYRCIEYLRAKKASNEEGLFRLSGSNLVIRTLKDRFNTEGDVDLLAEEEYYDVHAVASLFKTYLRELPSTILTRDLHIEFLRVLELDDKQQKILAFNALVHQLPRVNYSLLRTLSQYLLEVVQNSDRNKMSVKNVGIVFSPTLNIPAPVFAMFLTDFDAIFSHHKPQDQPEQPAQPEQQEDRGVRRTMLAPLGSDLQPEVRSPRHQMFSHLPTTPAMNQNSYSQNSSVQPNYAPDQSHQSDPAADLGMAPMQPSYESRKYVSIPSHPAPHQPMYPPPQPYQPQHQHQHQTNNQPQPRQQQYRMFAPQDAANDKAKRRESAMLLF